MEKAKSNNRTNHHESSNKTKQENTKSNNSTKPNPESPPSNWYPNTIPFIYNPYT